MLVSLGAAYVLPFEVFLFAYAVLGPLHYLTEISWLEKKNYFVKSKNDIWIFVLLVACITYGMFNEHSKVNFLVGSFIFSGFVYALIILFVDKLAIKLLLVVVAFVLSTVFNVNHYPDFSCLLFAIWVPTIVHVYLFTGLFILFGALKSRSVSGIISFVVFIACCVACFVYMPENIGISITEYGRKAYYHFRIVNMTIYNYLGFGQMKIDDPLMFVDAKAIAIMRFIAFAYTYHYLNWFSKTTVIKWNEISKTRMTAILVLWVASVVLYLISYKVGFYALFLLSMLHVFFEFPLNHHTIIGIGKELKQFSKR